MQFADKTVFAFVQAELGLCCSLTESVDTVVYVNKQKMSKLDCTDAHVHLDLPCPQIAQVPFRMLRMITMFCKFLNFKCWFRILNIGHFEMFFFFLIFSRK